MDDAIVRYPQDGWKKKLDQAVHLGEPVSLSVEQRKVGNFYLTGSIWYNGGPYGQGSYETGIRRITPLRGRGFFIMCSHYDLPIREALDEITWRLMAGWCPYETAASVEELKMEDVKAVLL